MDFILKVQKIKEPNTGNWSTTLSGGYENITGKVYDIKQYKAPDKIVDANGNPTDKTSNNGYYSGKGEITNLINPFTNQITNASVTLSKIESSFEDYHGWDQQLTSDIYFNYIASSVAEDIGKKYKKEYGVDIKFRVTKAPEEKKPDPTPPTEKKEIPTSGTASGATASGATASTAGATASGPQIYGEFVFDVTTENKFVSSQFGDLGVVTKGIQKDEIEEIPMDEEIDMMEEEIDEYSESGFIAQEEIINEPAILNMSLDKEREQEQEQQNESGTGAPEITLAGGGKMSGKVNVNYNKKTKGWGKVTKKMTDAQLLKAMVDYVEGGYYYPGHAYSRFSESDRKLYGSSGETLWGIDRCAGQTESTELGRKFWAAVDKISGHGKSTGTEGAKVQKKVGKKTEEHPYARATNTRNWNADTYPTKSGSLGYNKSPKPGTQGYDTMYNAFVDLAVGNLDKFCDNYLGKHAVRSLIYSDTRWKFCWFRATWNGPGWFQKYAKNIKKVYDGGTKDIEDLIIADLNHRASYGNSLITHDVKKMAQLLGIE